jgi:SAM-dependent methyltransferase
MPRSLPNPRQPLPAVRLLAPAPIRLLLTSATLLFVELLLIRWVPANVRYVGFFTNFLLMASFLGIGLGILLGRRAWRLPLSPFPLLLLATVWLVYSAQLNAQAQDPNEYFGLDASTSADANFVVLPLLIVLVTALLAALALPLGPLLRAMPPLRAYAIDIAGSMVGIAGFALLAYLGTGPTVWFVVVGILLLLLALGVGPTPWSVIGGAAMLMVIGSSIAVSELNLEAWSPYYRITAVDQNLMLASTDPDDGRPPRWLFVDGIPHQQMVDSETAAQSSLHRQAYAWFPDRTFDRVLIIGAGTGTDTALALARGAKHVDAVEIDPKLAQVGRDFHPEDVYDDPRVTVHVNDGRAFLNGSREQYDLVVYALTDSLTLVSSTAGVRLESFLFTEESMAAARDHLAPEGLFVMYNLYREPWLIAKLDMMLGDVFGTHLVRLPGPAEAVLAAGPAVDALRGAMPPGDRVDPVPVAGEPDPRAATDDWPFLHLRTATVAPYYLVALGFILTFGLVAVMAAARAAAASIRRFSPHFFCLGVAFLLLETKSLVSFSLLFGTTWVVNALAFFAILTSVLLAILVNARVRWRSPIPLYAALLAAIAIAYLMPADALLVDPPWLRYALAAVIAFAPVFIANLVFTHSFRDSTSADMAFASNLLGAMVGGALEYTALVSGFRALLLVVALLYVIAYITRRLGLLADRDLVDQRPSTVATSAA